MASSNLKEYRCVCGKLLFKGSLVSAVIEIKCKRCEEVNLFEEEFPQNIPIPFASEINKANPQEGASDLFEE